MENVKTARLMYGCGADWVYATKMPMSDPGYWYQDTTGQTHMLASTLDFAEVREKAQVDTIHPYPDSKTLRALDGSMPARLIQWWMKELEEAPDVIEVPQDFPAVFYQELKDLGYPVKSAWGAFFPERAIKTPDEIAMLRAAQQLNELGFTRLEEILRESTIGAADILQWQGDVLTSEILRAEMCKAQLEAGAIAFNGGPIVSNAAGSAMPHERGYGPIRAHTFILVDSFPTHSNHYVGDLTRTYLKGTADDWHVGVYEAVLGALEQCLLQIKAGADGRALHDGVMDYLAQAGFPAGTGTDGVPYGMIHGTGHGVGLEVHDFPSGTISGRPGVLEAGVVTSVEPGLYYPGDSNFSGGGCRIEDVVVVTKDGYDNLTTLDKTDWVIA